MNSMILSLLNLGTQNESFFSVLSNQGPFELRFYQTILCAKVTVPGLFEEAVKNGIKHLFDYVQGNNFKVHEIKNFGHFFHIHKVNSWDVGLILPTDLNSLSVPKPINRQIKIQEFAPTKVATLRFKGPVSHKIIENRAEDLRKWIRFKGMIAVGPLKVIQHDSFFRMNEVQMDVE